VNGLLHPQQTCSKYQQRTKQATFGWLFFCMKLLRKIDEVLFSKPTAKEIATNDLEEHKRQLLKEIAAMHYHSRMVDYHYAVIAELQEQAK
jgi:hypothetical protein